MHLAPRLVPKSQKPALGRVHNKKIFSATRCVIGSCNPDEFNSSHMAEDLDVVSANGSTMT